MGTSAWVASLIGLADVMLGGLISFTVSHQQIREARSQRADEAHRERQQRSEERRSKAYTDLVICHRSVQNALHFFYSQAASKPSLSDMNSLLQAAYNSSAMVFLVTETERTCKACIGVLRILHHTQDVISDSDGSPPDGDAWPELDVTMGHAMREFENAARAELDVHGPEWLWIERGRPN
jgi:hypothetical protein